MILLIYPQISHTKPILSTKSVNQEDNIDLLISEYNLLSREELDIFVVEYFKKYNNRNISTNNLHRIDKKFSILCKLILDNVNLPDNYQEFFDRILYNIKDKLIDLNESNVQVKPESFKEKIIEKSFAIIDELEYSFDEYILSDFKMFPSPKAILSVSAKGVHANYIKKYFKNKRQEFDELLTTKDKELIEGYSNFTKSEIKKLVSYCDCIIEECNNIIGVSKKSRKIRKKKEKSLDTLISKVNICKEFSELKLKSIDPKLIVAATELWVYNIKYKKLGCYISNDSEGFRVKGTTIIDFNENRSIQKIIRKPEEILPVVLEGNKNKLNSLLKNIKTTENKLTGRLNNDVILLRII